MPKDILRDWSFSVPWGKLSLVSWGNPSGDAVLLVHGRGDSAATFIPLLELLPDTYYYVAVDLPGCGKSDPLPTGLRLMRLHFMVAIEFTVKHLGWKNFVYIGHSMGSEIGLFYNAVYPGHIKKIIHLDPSLGFQRLQVRDYPQYISYYDEYYKNYNKYNNDDRIYTKKKAVEAVMRARGMTEDQAEVILSRNLKRVGEDQYKLTWDRRMKFPVPWLLPNEYYFQLFSKNSPPTLVISALDTKYISIEAKEAADKLMQDLELNCKHFYIKNITGHHDVHFTNPERFLEHLCSFLNKDLKKFSLRCDIIVC